MKTILNVTTDGKFSVVANKKSISTAIVLFAVAIAVFVMANKMSDFAYIGMILLGIVLSIIAFIKFVNGRDYVYLPTRSKLSKKTLFFNISDTSAIRNILDTGDYRKLKKHYSASNSGGAKLDVIVSEDKTYAAYRLYVYVPYDYEPVTELIDVVSENVGQFVETVYCK